MVKLLGFLFTVLVCSSNVYSILITGKILNTNSVTLSKEVKFKCNEENKSVNLDSSGNFQFILDSNMSCNILISSDGFKDTIIQLQATDSVVSLNSISLISIEKKSNPVINPTDRMVVLVKGKQGQIASLKNQKQSDNLKTVVSAELIAALPDHSTADALQRVPGISVERSQGEGRYVQIRGTESNLSTVTVNGQSIASPDGQTRAISLNVIPADQLAEIEVSKVLTPEMDGDAIGGNINLKTATASSEKWKGSLVFVPGYAQLSDAPIWQGSSTISKRWLRQGKLGLYAGVSYYLDTKGTHNFEMAWDTSTFNTTSNGLSLPLNLEFRDYENKRNRFGTNVSMDYRFSEANRVYWATSFNRDQSEELRRRLLFDAESGDARHESLDNRYVKDVPVTRSVRFRNRVQDILSTSIRQEYSFGENKLNTGFTYSLAKTDEPDRIDASFSFPYNIFFDVTNPQVPEYIPYNLSEYQRSAISHIRTGTPLVLVYDTAYDNMSHFTTNRIMVQNKNSEEHNLTGKIDFEWKIPWFGKLFTSKNGFKAGMHTKEQIVRAQLDTLPQNQETLLINYLDSYNEPNFFNNHYELNNMPDISLLKDFYSSITTQYPPETGMNLHLDIDPQNFEAQDYNFAAYTQLKYHRGPTTIISGLRVEYTTMHYEGYIVQTDGSLQANWYRTDPLSMDKHFIFLLPMVLGRYSLTPNIGLRASYTHSFARPDWYDLVPHSLIQNEDGIITVTTGNPDLKPPTAHNLDYSVEWYTGGKSLVSAGVFYKRMDNYIVNTAVTSYPSGGKTQWIYYQNINGDYADLAGTELDFRQKASFLPSFLSGFGADINYTYTWSNTQIPGENHDSYLPKQSAHTSNFALFYEKYGFNARVGLNYRSHFINEIASYQNRDNKTFPNLNVMVDDHIQLDASASQQLGSRFTMFIEVNNILNTPYMLYIKDTDHPVQKEYYSWSLQTGVKVKI